MNRDYCPICDDFYDPASDHEHSMDEARAYGVSVRPTYDETN